MEEQASLSKEDKKDSSSEPFSYTDFLKQDFGEPFEILDLDLQQKQFLRSRWLDQVLWMEKKAADCRDQYRILRLTAIIFGVIVPILVGLDTDNSLLDQVLRYLAIAFGAVAAVCSAIEEFFHYGDRWYSYRRAVESLKAQGWQFSQLSGPYRQYSSHKGAFKSFADQVEEIIARDVETYVTQMTQQQQVEPLPPETGDSASHY